jgi:transcriptional regulator with XRE-family HTH domain
MNAKKVGHRIKIRRTVLDITQLDLAKQLGISQTYLSMMENGDRPIDSEMLVRIAKVLDCEPVDLTNERRRLA